MTRACKFSVLTVVMALIYAAFAGLTIGAMIPFDGMASLLLFSVSIAVSSLIAVHLLTGSMRSNSNP